MKSGRLIAALVLIFALPLSANAAPEITYSAQDVQVPERVLPLKMKMMHIWRATDRPYYEALEKTFQKRGNYLEVSITNIPSFGMPQTDTKRGYITMTNSADKSMSVSIVTPEQEELAFYECEKPMQYTMRYKYSDQSGPAAISDTMAKAGAIAMRHCMIELQNKMHADIDQIEEWNTQFVPGYGQ